MSYQITKRCFENGLQQARRTLTKKCPNENFSDFEENDI
jgi:hypothetical protein